MAANIVTREQLSHLKQAIAGISAKGLLYSK
jgi:hypothetical protein